MTLEILQEILLQLPIAARLPPCFAAKFLWHAASAGEAGSSPLAPLLPPPALGPPRAWELAPADDYCLQQLDKIPFVASLPIGAAWFPPRAASKARNRWLLQSGPLDEDGDPSIIYAVRPTPKGNPRALKNLALAGGGTARLHGATKWMGVNFFRGVEIRGDMTFGPGSQITLVGCHIKAPIKQLGGGGSLTLIGCTVDAGPPRAGGYGVKLGADGHLLILNCTFVHRHTSYVSNLVADVHARKVRKRVSCAISYQKPNICQNRLVTNMGNSKTGLFSRSTPRSRLGTASLRAVAKASKSVRKIRFFTMPFCTKPRLFAKTGSGQRWE
jgi:hypothetical protein